MAAKKTRNAKGAAQARGSSPKARAPVKGAKPPRVREHARPQARGIVGVGEQSATFVVIPLPRAQAQRLLPAELTLVPTNVAGEGMHPLICAFGVQRNVHTVFPPSHSHDAEEIAAYLTELRQNPDGARLLALAMTYREVITAIPYVT